MNLLSPLLFTKKNLPAVYFFSQQEFINCLRVGKEERGKPWSPANHALKFTAIGRWPGIELAEPGYPAAHQLRKGGFLLGKAGVARIAKTP